MSDAINELGSIARYLANFKVHDFTHESAELSRIAHELDAELEALREQVRWRKWPDEKPPKGKAVLWRCSTGSGPPEPQFPKSRYVTIHWLSIFPIPTEPEDSAEETSDR